MCDTMVALHEATADGSVIFAKNSDRHPNEAQSIEHHPAAEYPGGSKLQCTYIEIPQAKYTNAVFLCRPFWMWGAEMGVNKHGVVIGNEAIFSKIPSVKEPRLLGMDLLRLGLERGDSARGALEVITELLEEYGQGGNCAHNHKFYYHNSFLIVDKREAWVLETIDRLWVAKKVNTSQSMSNVLSIGAEWDLASEDFISNTRSQIRSANSDQIHVERCFSDKLITRAACSRERQSRSSELLRKSNGGITAATMMNILHDHNDDGEGRFLNGLFNKTLCAHAGWGPARKATQTTGSLIVKLTEHDIEIWVTGTSAPCISLFKPVWFDDGLPDTGTTPGATFDPGSLWWKHELLHRLTIWNYPLYTSLYCDELREMQDRFICKAGSLAPAERKDLTAQCFNEAAQKEDEWTDRVKKEECSFRLSLLSRRVWEKFNKKANITI